MFLHYNGFYTFCKKPYKLSNKLKWTNLFLSELADFCDALQHPLKIPKPNAINLTNLNRPLCPGDQISCLDVLREITTQVITPWTGCKNFDMLVKSISHFKVNEENERNLF